MTMTTPMVTDLLAVAVDGFDAGSRLRLAGVFRDTGRNLEVPGRARFRLALADFTEQPQDRLAANALVAAALDLAPEQRELERGFLDMAAVPGETPYGMALYGVRTAIIDLLDATSLRVDVRQLDALRNQPEHVTALPVTFTATDGTVVRRGVVVG